MPWNYFLFFLYFFSSPFILKADKKIVSCKTREEIIMARQADYAAKIEVLQKKIAKKSEELKVLKAELADWKKKKKTKI